MNAFSQFTKFRYSSQLHYSLAHRRSSEVKQQKEKKSSSIFCSNSPSTSGEYNLIPSNLSQATCTIYIVVPHKARGQGPTIRSPPPALSHDVTFISVESRSSVDYIVEALSLSRCFALLIYIYILLHRRRLWCSSCGIGHYWMPRATVESNCRQLRGGDEPRVFPEMRLRCRVLALSALSLFLCVVAGFAWNVLVLLCIFFFFLNVTISRSYLSRIKRFLWGIVRNLICNKQTMSARIYFFSFDILYYRDHLTPAMI